MKIKQCTLKSGNTFKMCWLDKINKISKGCEITLKDSNDPKRLWKIIGISKSIDSDLLGNERSIKWNKANYRRVSGVWQDGK